jgi:hypothetical protein
MIFWYFVIGSLAFPALSLRFWNINIYLTRYILYNSRFFIHNRTDLLQGVYAVAMREPRPPSMYQCIMFSFGGAGRLVGVAWVFNHLYVTAIACSHSSAAAYGPPACARQWWRGHGLSRSQGFPPAVSLVCSSHRPFLITVTYAHSHSMNTII